MEIVREIVAVRRLVGEARAAGKTIGFVPTMGALHAGHVSLIGAAGQKCGFVVVSIFVNPTQFGPGEDLKKYPRDIDADIKICAETGVDVVFAPSVSEMYSRKNFTWVNVAEVTENLCGRFRPGHFRGVATVCAKLFNIVCPDIAFFGQKDAQQAIVVKRMAADLNMALEIELCPTVRETDGLAVSSRNRYLSQSERKDAGLLYAALQECQKKVSAGCRNCSDLIKAMRGVLGSSESVEIEYISIVDNNTLKDIERIEGRAMAAVAVRLGPTRLIDNILIGLDKL